MNWSRQTRARLARIASFFKRRWEFEDYPIDYVDQGEVDPNLPTRLQHHRWRVDLINWYAVSGLGNSKEAALADAKQKFAVWNSSGEKMWRPGTGPGIVFPENQTIEKYAELRDDFIHRVLELEWAWLTDESSLWDFHQEVDNNIFYTKIIEVYGVDVSDILNANIVSILERISPENINS
jgi:hypothetical protein